MTVAGGSHLVAVSASTPLLPRTNSSRSHRKRTGHLRRACSILLFVLLSFVIAIYTIRYLPYNELLVYGHWESSLKDMPNATFPNITYQPPFRTSGRHIVDSNGERFKLASINWYGASDIFFIPGGLDFRHRSDIAKTIKKMGFNSVRFPYSDQLVIENPIVPPELISANLDLMDDYPLKYGSRDEDDIPFKGPRALDVFHACVKAMTDEGLAVIPNNHITNAAWCDGTNLCDASWKNDQYGPICKVYQTTETWIDHWKTIMEPHIDNPWVMGADLRNEPRGVWGTMTWNALSRASEQASEELLKLQPNWLMFFEGIGSANDCSGARLRPIELSVPNRVVYSAHVYKWSGWGGLVSYDKRPYPSFALDMEKNWGYLLQGNVAPVWVGEFGAPLRGGNGDHHYWDNLMKYLAILDVDFGYWALNPRKADGYSHESYGVLQDDWETPHHNDYRMDDLRKLMAPLPASTE